jgi:hypothetical protein
MAETMSMTKPGTSYRRYLLLRPPLDTASGPHTSEAHLEMVAVKIMLMNAWQDPIASEARYRCVGDKVMAEQMAGRLRRSGVPSSDELDTLVPDWLAWLAVAGVATLLAALAGAAYATVAQVWSLGLLSACGLLVGLGMLWRVLWQAERLA